MGMGMVEYTRITTPKQELRDMAKKALNRCIHIEWKGKSDCWMKDKIEGMNLHHYMVQHNKGSKMRLKVKLDKYDLAKVWWKLIREERI